MRIVVTGATGYIGIRLTALMLKRGHDIIIASRQRPSDFSAAWFYYDLSSSDSVVLPTGTDVIVHLAANTQFFNCMEEGFEVAAAKKLIKSAQDVGAKFVFVSSQTARKDAPTEYGRTKWHIENEVFAANGLVVRPGQVYGGEERGLFGTLVRFVRHLPVLPAFLPPPLVQPIHVDDFTIGLLRLVERVDIPSGVYSLASPNAISFTALLRSIAQHRIRHRKIFVPVPISFVRLFIKFCGVKLSAKLGMHRLNSLFDLTTMDTMANLNEIGLELRTLRSGMHPSGSGRRRRLIHEGIALLTYVLRDRPHSDIVRRYVRMIETLRAGIPLDMPDWSLRWPTTLALLDDRAFVNLISVEEFSWRLDAATVIAEASVQGSVRFLGTTQFTHPLTALGRIFLALSAEFFWRLSRRIVLPLLLCAKKGKSF